MYIYIYILDQHRRDEVQQRDRDDQQQRHADWGSHAACADCAHAILYTLSRSCGPKSALYTVPAFFFWPCVLKKAARGLKILRLWPGRPRVPAADVCRM